LQYNEKAADAEDMHCNENLLMHEAKFILDLCLTLALSCRLLSCLTISINAVSSSSALVKGKKFEGINVTSKKWGRKPFII